MRNLKDFIEVTSIIDGRKSIIRVDCISAIHDNDAQELDFGIKPEHRLIDYGDGSIAVRESTDELCDMMYNAEF